MTTVYFVCFGNTCRSPMAADILRLLMAERGDDRISVGSFGTTPYYKDNPQVKRLREYAVKTVMGRVEGLKNHKPRGIDGVDIVPSDRFILLAPGYEADLKRQLRTKELDAPLIVWDIPDPFTKPLAEYIECAKLLRTKIERSYDSLVAGVERSV